MAEQEAVPSLAQPAQELCVAAVSVGLCALHAAGHSEEDRVPPALELLEKVQEAAWAVCLAAAWQGTGPCPRDAGEAP